jgi:hypothetical protein
LPAPPSFTGLALGGLAALSLIEEESPEMKMPERYPGYDVLNKRNSVSWNDKTREVIDSRLAIDSNRHLFFTDEADRARGLQPHRAAKRGAAAPGAACGDAG